MAQAGRHQRHDRSVAIAGGGITGMTAALFLLEAGYHVTVLEKTPAVGGKFGAEQDDHGGWHEHAYHFLSDWCLNFWEIARRIGLSKKRHFVRRDSIKFLRPRASEDQPGKYTFYELKHGAALGHFWDNVYSGVIPPNDMIVYVYSLLDLLTRPDDDPDELEFLNRNSVNGFMRSRSYMTPLAALLHQEALLKAFAVPSYDTSVRSYRTFLRYFGRDSGGWIMKGDVRSVFWDPFVKRLERFDGRGGRPRFQLQTDAPLERIRVALDPKIRGRLRVIGIDIGGHAPLQPEHLVLAIPWEAVVPLVERNVRLRTRLSDLLGLRKLRSRQMASLDLCFKRPLPGIPPEHVTLIDDANWDDPLSLAYDGDMASRYGLSFVDNYQAWYPRRSRRKTWLNVVSADFDELAGLPCEEARDRIIKELGRFLHFDSADIDWQRTKFRRNADAPLFSNSVGSWQSRPETRENPEYKRRWVHSRVSNLYVAGDYCRSKIDLVCLEGAVTTGIAAARAIAGNVVKAPLVPPEVSRQECLVAKAALLPWLLAATAKDRLPD